MRNLKTFAVALAIMICSSSFAGSNPISDKSKNSSSFEVGKFLKGHFFIEKDYKGKVYFSLDKDRKIVVHSVLCEDRVISATVNDRLQNRVLSDSKLEVGKVYVLPLYLKAVK